VEHSGFIWWRWEARNHRDDTVLESTKEFGTFSECLADAETSGYVPPEKRT
jgi:hypothetical protein